MSAVYPIDKYEAKYVPGKLAPRVPKIDPILDFCLWLHKSFDGLIEEFSPENGQ